MSPPARSSLGRRVLGGVLLGVVVYAGIVLWIDIEDFRRALAKLPLYLVPAAMALSFANYLIRFAKWERYRRLLGVELPVRTSFQIYLAGFSMGVTPGKMGEVLKSWMIRRVTGTRIHRTAPIVVAERVTDLLGYLILMAIGGIASVEDFAWIFWITLALCLVALLLAGSHGFARTARWTVAHTPYFWRLAPKVEGAFESARVLLAPREIVAPTLVSVVSWGCECVGFWLIADAMVEGDVPFLFAVFAYAFSAVAGAVAIVFPGGLVVTEGALGTLLRRKYQEVAALPLDAARSSAAGAALVTRLCTLWFGVAVGALATWRFQRTHGAIELEDGDEDAKAVTEPASQFTDSRRNGANP